MPFCTRLVALKKIIPAFLLLGSLNLAFTPKTSAQITFSVDEFTSNTLTVTLHAGSLGVADGSFTPKEMWLVSNEGAPGGWVQDAVVAQSQVGVWGTASAVEVRTSLGVDESGGLLFEFDSDLSAAGELMSDLTYTFAAMNLFDLGQVSTFALYWGDPSITGQTLQTSGAAVTGGGSAVPEPSSFAAFVGLAALGLVASRRRRMALLN